MYVKVVFKNHNVMFECDRIVETEGCLQFMVGSEVTTQHNPAIEDEAAIYIMNDNGKTIDHYNFCKLLKSEQSED